MSPASAAAPAGLPPGPGPSPGGRFGPGGRSPPPPWIPKTELGKKVHSGEITTMSAALHSGLPLREAGIVDALLPGLHDRCWTSTWSNG